VKWPFIIFGVLLALVLARVWWTERRYRRERAKASAEYMSTALLQQQEAFAQARAQMEAVFNSMTEGVLVLDSKGLIHLYNQSFQRLFSLPPHLGGQTLQAAAPKLELHSLAERLKVEKKILGFEMVLPGAPERFIEVNAVTIYDQKGQQQGATFVFHDVTRIKHLEKTRREFVANVSHELRTPLSLIKGFVETLLEGAKDDPAVATRFLSNIEKHADRLTFLIEDLLTISRLESRQVSMNLQEVELGMLVKKVLDDLEARALEREVKVQNKVPVPLLARVDADRTEQVVFNLVENAIKYGHRGGTVLVGGGEAPDGMLQVWVQDDGPGIPSESKERIFERFYRIDRARSRETGGTGLGLAIVKHIVQAHGGEVRVESDLGRGAKFLFTVPKA
jgi:two-component system phosphate regulon sensor histidine kinase PhoR